MRAQGFSPTQEIDGPRSHPFKPYPLFASFIEAAVE
jgi:hypothetical protein